MFMRTGKGISLAVLALALTAPAAFAHGVWLGVRCDKTCVVLGEGAKDNAYDPAMVTRVRGYTVDHGDVDVGVEPREDHVSLALPENAAVVAVDFDYGYWSKGADGKYVNKPMDQVPDAVLATHAIKFNVSYLDPEAEIRPIEDLEMQLVPSVNPASLKKGDVFEVRLLHKGEPMKDTPVMFDVVNDLGGTMTNTDENGRAKVAVRNNALNVIGVEVAIPEPEDAKCTQKKYFATLSFICHPDYD